MIKFLVDLGMFYQPKNKLCKAVQEFMGKQQRKVFSAHQMMDFKKYLKKNVEALNKQFPKCTPVQINFWSPDGSDHMMSIESVVSLSMKLFKDEEYQFNNKTIRGDSGTESGIK